MQLVWECTWKSIFYTTHFSPLVITIPTQKKQLSNYPIALWIIYHQGRLNHQRRVEKRPRPGRYWKPWRLVSWNLKQNIFTVWALAMYQYSNLNIHMYGRWTSDEHGLKPDRIERLDDLPLPHIRLWAASSSSSDGFQSLVLEITNRSNHGSVTLREYQIARDQKKVTKVKIYVIFAVLLSADGGPKLISRTRLQ